MTLLLRSFLNLKKIENEDSIKYISEHKLVGLKKKTCAENSKQFLALSSSLENFQNNS